MHSYQHSYLLVTSTSRLIGVSSILDKRANQVVYEFPSTVEVGQEAEAEPTCQANEWVVGQLLHEENIRRLKEAYSSLTENVARIEDLGDNIFLRGKPAGTCFLCPKNSIV